MGASYRLRASLRNLIRLPDCKLGIAKRSWK
jgi:hypothetical protein